MCSSLTKAYAQIGYNDSIEFFCYYNIMQKINV